MLTFAKEIELTDSNLAEELRMWVHGIVLRDSGAFPG